MRELVILSVANKSVPSAINTRRAASLSVAFIVRRHHMYKETRSHSKIPNTDPRSRSIRPVGNKRAKSGSATGPLSDLPLPPSSGGTINRICIISLSNYQIRIIDKIGNLGWSPAPRSRIGDRCSFHVDIIPFTLFRSNERVGFFVIPFLRYSRFWTRFY